MTNQKWEMCGSNVKICVVDVRNILALICSHTCTGLFGNKCECVCRASDSRIWSCIHPFPITTYLMQSEPGPSSRENEAKCTLDRLSVHHSVQACMRAHTHTYTHKKQEQLGKTNSPASHTSRLWEEDRKKKNDPRTHTTENDFKAFTYEFLCTTWKTKLNL